MRTILEVRKDLLGMVKLGVNALYWYLSLLLIVVSGAYYIPEGFAGDIILSFALGIALMYVFNVIALAWMFFFTKDYNGVHYFINVFTKCYFEGSSFDKFNERTYKNE